MVVSQMLQESVKIPWVLNSCLNILIIHKQMQILNGILNFHICAVITAVDSILL